MLKICGIKYPDNMSSIDALNPDYIGMIFYSKSKRNINLKDYKKFPKTKAKKVGVFVNSSIEEIKRHIECFQLNVVQLHGDEAPSMCDELSKSIEVWKAFGVDENFDFKSLEKYHAYCSHFVFDAKGEQRGGNGHAFEWSALEKYTGEKPFLLSGGIGPQNIEHALKIRHASLKGFDLNSKLEEEPGRKNIEESRNIINKLRHAVSF